MPEFYQFDSRGGGVVEKMADETRVRLLVGQSVLVVVRDWALAADIEQRLASLSLSGVHPTGRVETDQHVEITYTSGGIVRLLPTTTMEIDDAPGH